MARPDDDHATGGLDLPLDDLAIAIAAKKPVVPPDILPTHPLEGLDEKESQRSVLVSVAEENLSHILHIIGSDRNSKPRRRQRLMPPCPYKEGLAQRGLEDLR